MLIIGSNKPSKALSVFYHIKALTSNVNESFKTSFSLSRIILITSLASQGISFAYTVLVWHNRYSRKGSGGRISKFSVYKYTCVIPVWSTINTQIAEVKSVILYILSSNFDLITWLRLDTTCSNFFRNVMQLVFASIAHTKHPKKPSYYIFTVRSLFEYTCIFNLQ